MESNDTKIRRILKTPGVFNWAKQNWQRFDATLAEVRKMADNPPRRSLAVIDGICRRLANREISYTEAIDACASYTGYLRMAADEILPVFDEWLTVNQIDPVTDLPEDTFPYPYGIGEDGKTRTIPVRPTFVAMQGERLLPVFLLGWTTPRFSLHQMRLISSIIADAVLTRQDFSGCDAMVLLLPRGKWGKGREPKNWLVSAYADMTQQEMQHQFDRYNRAVRQVVEELRSR